MNNQNIYNLESVETWHNGGFVCDICDNIFCNIKYTFSKHLTSCEKKRNEYSRYNTTIYNSIHDKPPKPKRACRRVKKD